MTEVVDYDEYNEQKKRRSHGRRKCAESQFSRARSLASQHGMILQQHTEVHYTLWGPNRSWQKHIYPGNQRLYAPDRNGPFLRIDSPWTLLDVVNAAAEQETTA